MPRRIVAVAKVRDKCLSGTSVRDFATGDFATVTSVVTSVRDFATGPRLRREEWSRWLGRCDTCPQILSSR